MQFADLPANPVGAASAAITLGAGLTRIAAEAAITSSGRFFSTQE